MQCKDYNGKPSLSWAREFLVKIIYFVFTCVSQLLYVYLIRDSCEEDSIRSLTLASWAGVSCLLWVLWAALGFSAAATDAGDC